MKKKIDMDYMEKVILPQVEKPIRYVGNELNSVIKDHDKLDVSMAFAFPDVYEVGMSHLGTQILYHCVNERDTYCLERVFCPWVDMQEKMLEEQIPLYSLETKTPVTDFDFLGFTLQYELSYTNILSMLALAGIPFYAKERDGSYPLIIGGGPCAFNPEPVADFFDLFLIGDGEETLITLLDLYAEHKGKGLDKTMFLSKAAQMRGIYVPSFYDATYDEQGALLSFTPNRNDVPTHVKKSLLKNLDDAPFPEKPVVPFMDIVHDRVMLEVLRGCTHGCRFCQAGIIYRPVRERSKTCLLNQAKSLIAATGHEDISLTSLSTADHSQLSALVDDLQTEFAVHAVGISLPSLRVDSFSMGMAKKIATVRKTGLTFAPEAGTQRMRDVINKGVCEDDLMQVAEDAFRAGWQRIKLYFMIGLPFEEEPDLDGISRLGNKVLYLGKNVAKEIKSTRRISVTLSASSFVPKPFTPFQWWGQDTLETLKEKQYYIKDRVRSKNLQFDYHKAEISHLEGAFSRGDRRLSQVLVKAHELGCRYDGWDEFFDFKAWQTAFSDCGLSSSWYAQRTFEYTDLLPWDFIDVGVKKSFLYREYEKAKLASLTPDCRDEGCTGCGICTDWDCAMDIKGVTNCEV